MGFASPPPVAEFAKLPPIADIDLSPDGNKAVMLNPLNGTYHAVVRDLASGKNQLVMAADPESFLFNWCRFANNERVVCSIRSYTKLKAGQDSNAVRRYRDPRTVVTRLLSVDADGKNLLQLIPTAITRSRRDLAWNPPAQDNVISWLPDEPNHILIQLAREDRIHPTVYRLNIYNNRMTKARRLHTAVTRWYADPEGNVRIGAGYRNLRPVVFSLTSGWRELDLGHLSGINPPELLAFAPQGMGVWISANNQSPTRGIYRADIETGAILQTLAEDPDYDILRGLMLHPQTREPLMLRYVKDVPVTVWFDAEIRERVERVAAILPGAPSIIEVIATDDSVNRMVLASQGNATLPAWYLYDHEAKRLDPLARAYRGIGTPVEAQIIRYAAGDGTTIPAYVSLPGPEAGGPYPTVLLPHGGPYARDTGRFDYWTQFLVSRGYAVLQPNYRGSSGYGDPYMASGFKQWGGTMQSDLIDGLDWMIESGYTDPQRVCIVGGSYGGYAALVASFQTPERFRCGVSFAGVTDLDDLVGRARNFLLGELTIAVIPDGAERDANSPMQRVEDIALPLLIVHGVLDRSVMIEQSQKLVRALAAAGKPFEYIEQPNGDHYLGLESNRLQFLEALEAFLARHLAPVSR